MLTCARACPRLNRSVVSSCRSRTKRPPGYWCRPYGWWPSAETETGVDREQVRRTWAVRHGGPQGNARLLGRALNPVPDEGVGLARYVRAEEHVASFEERRRWRARGASRRRREARQRRDGTPCGGGEQDEGRPPGTGWRHAATRVTPVGGDRDPAVTSRDPLSPLAAFPWEGCFEPELPARYCPADGRGERPPRPLGITRASVTGPRGRRRRTARGRRDRYLAIRSACAPSDETLTRSVVPSWRWMDEDVDTASWLP